LEIKDKQKHAQASNDKSKIEEHSVFESNSAKAKRQTLIKTRAQKQTTGCQQGKR